MSRRLWLLLPLLVFVGFVAAAAWRLSDPPDTTIKSRMVGRAVPAFTAAPMLPGRPGLASAELGQGKPRLVNFFASWCVPCIAEAPVLLELQKRGVVIDGIALRDQPQDIAKFLADNGDPFRAIGSDPVGEAQIALGSSGVPESFIIDGKGIIRYQHIGPILPEQLGEVMDEWGKAR
ncbi:DsbE family thiol:disulfide interchange protein [Sphingomonas astaxanthinifaciens]|uniref:Thiol:disulfide interchange protein n=1 Tax=Sphingomonas astaxanthinifaciens DSM 22298 TaxID=1123267 RepID=A0ABQ5Z7E2_9SPHN|nr:DsbE family thiol:disulfide interchange protein [Sphingomonas astaxanthinifaciens]GLR48608.1 thiol:disulfide interchange protein [Sphingomonas astaxanthinifaciens DSM 22298]